MAVTKQWYEYPIPNGVSYPKRISVYDENGSVQYFAIKEYFGDNAAGFIRACGRRQIPSGLSEEKLQQLRLITAYTHMVNWREGATNAFVGLFRDMEEMSPDNQKELWRQWVTGVWQAFMAVGLGVRYGDDGDDGHDGHVGKDYLDEKGFYAVMKAFARRINALEPYIGKRIFRCIDDNDGSTVLASPSEMLSELADFWMIEAIPNEDINLFDSANELRDYLLDDSILKVPY